VLANCADWELHHLLGEPSGPKPVGNQLKINMVLRRLPRLRSGIDPRTAFAGTLHLHQDYTELKAAHRAATQGRLPDPFPCEVYCHTLTDPSILDPALAEQGWHTLTLFGLHAPATLFAADLDSMREQAGRAALASLQSVLAEPLTDCVATDADGRPCVEVMTPLDVQAAVGMPGGHIFHGDLSWPWLTGDEPADTPEQRWGVATPHPGLLLCGSSRRRGGAVSGLGGHSAAMALLER
jgi:phytoene dehydrogenase-like protein